jgi:hypothetical protein
MEEAAAPDHPRGRLIGLVYLLYALASPPSSFLLKQLILPNDAAGTAHSILAHEALYQLGVSFGLIANVLYLALTALLYDLLKPVGRRVALVFAFSSLAGCIVQLVGALFLIAPLVILKDSQMLSAFPPGQLQAAAVFALKMYSRVYYVSFVLFGLFDLGIGWLIFRSRFLPRFIGILMMLGGLGALAFLWPPFATKFLAYLIAVGGVAELALLLWLLVMGVDIARWRQRTGVP